MPGKITPFTMPKWGIEMEEGVIREWCVREGQKVNQGELLAVIETDKIANDVELEFTGTLRRLVGNAEDAYKVGALIAVFADDDVTDAEIDAFVSNFKGVDASFAHADIGAASAPVTNPPTAIPDGLSVSPKAAELARTLGVDLSGVTGSGRNGRVSLQDVEQAAKRQGLFNGADEIADNPYTVIKLTAMRRTIAKRLTEATQTIPHFYLRTVVSITSLIGMRQQARDGGADTPSINDYLIKASAFALMKEPEVNSHFMGDEIHQFRRADISVAVAVPGGLITPVVRGADQKSVSAIAVEMRDFAERARAGTMAQEEYQGGTFSLSNLGMYGVTSFDAVVNPPMAAILAAGTIQRAPTEAGDFESVMHLTLSCDHRAIDGALGGRFLQALKFALENPADL